MHRQQLKSLLDNYQPQYSEEIISKEQMLTFLKEHADCFERSCIPGHFTGSAWLLNREGTHALLMHHRKLNDWFQTGGHCDGDSDILAVAVKEAQEESGIVHIIPVSNQIFDIDIHPIPARPNEPVHYHYDIRFLLQAQSDEPLIHNEESLDLKWFGKDESTLPTQSFSIVRMFRKWVKMDGNKNFMRQT